MAIDQSSKPTSVLDSLGKRNIVRRIPTALKHQVVPGERLQEEARAWARELTAVSPTALKFLKCAFNLADGGLAAQAQFADASLQLYLKTDECKEGRDAFAEKRKPDFAAHR